MHKLDRPASALTRKQRVTVVGAGIAGLVCAYELHNAGYQVTVLEARERVGGRVWTLRGGDEVIQRGHPTQHVAFDTGHYFNAGAARIPTHHSTILHYCRELKVVLESFNTTHRNHLIRFPTSDVSGGATADLSLNTDGCLSMREVGDSIRGHLAQWLHRSIERGDLDGALSPSDHRLVVDYLSAYGDLDPQGRYNGTRRRGQDQLFTEPAVLDDVRTQLPPSRIFDAALWHAIRRDNTVEGAPTMLQPVGGMDALPRAFHRHLGDVVRLAAKVEAIANT